MNECRIFVSYSHSDLQLVSALVQLLRVTDVPIFRDVEDIRPGHKWRAVLSDAIEACETLLLFWCRHSSESKEVKSEYSSAMQSGKRVVPVRLDDTELPPELAEYQAINLRNVLGGHEDGYVSQTVRVPGLMAGGGSTKVVQRLELLLPNAWTLHEASQQLYQKLEQLLHAATDGTR